MKLGASIKTAKKAHDVPVESLKGALPEEPSVVPAKETGGPEVVSPVEPVLAPKEKKESYAKGFLTDAFAGAVGMTLAKVFISSSIRAVSPHLVFAAPAVGLVGAGSALIKDRKQARKAANVHGGEVESIKALVKKNKARYAKHFLISTAAGFAGAWVADAAIEHFGWLKDTVETAPDVTEPTVLTVNDIPPAPADGGAFLPAMDTTLVEDGLPEIFEPYVVPADVLPVEDTSDVLSIITPAPAAIDQLAALADSGQLGERAQYTLDYALQGKSWAMNEAIDGLLNNRFGWAENKELAAALTQELAATGDEEGLLKLAYMQYNEAFTAIGIEHNPQAALDTVKELGRSWYGAPEVLERVQGTMGAVSLPDAPALAANEAITCNAVENTAGMSPVFNTSCSANLQPGDLINLDLELNTGEKSYFPLVVGQQVETMTSQDYLNKALSSILNRQVP